MNAWTGVFTEAGAWQVAATGLAAAAAISFATWVASLVRRDASLIDRSWSLMILAASLAFVATWTPPASTEPRTTALLWVMAAWALRLSAYVTWRNWGHGEDRRYQAIRARNQPNFALKSLVWVFALQAVLAWVVALPALAAAGGARPFGVLDVIGLVIAVAGLAIEATSDAQMARFKGDPAHRGQVMDRGLWRYSRHPNYFGECLLWWGLGLVGLASGGGAWCLLSPLLMTVLLLKVSGVALLEKDIGERRPAYREYIARTNAFVPGPPRSKGPS